MVLPSVSLKLTFGRGIGYPSRFLLDHLQTIALGGGAQGTFQGVVRIADKVASRGAKLIVVPRAYITNPAIDLPGLTKSRRR